MKRDFTDTNLNEVNLLLDGLKAEDNDAIVSKACGIVSCYPAALSRIGGNTVLRLIIQDNNNMSHKKRLSRTQLKKVFSDERGVDNQHALGMLGFGITYDALIDLQNAMVSLTSANNYCTVAINRGDPLQHFFNPATIKRLTSAACEKLLDKIEILKIGADYTAHDFNLIPNSVKKQRIDEVELENPEYKKLFAAVLADPDLTDQERIDMKFMAYSAPEPYRSLYLEHLSDFKLNVDNVKGNYYSPGKKQIHFYASDQTFENNPRGAYITAFHESGHLIDDHESGDFLWIVNSKTESYTYNGKTLNECLTEDTRNYVRNILDTDPAFSTLSKAEKQQLMKNLNLTDDAAFTSGGTPATSSQLQNAQTKLQTIMAVDLQGEQNTGPSDVYGGVTNNAVKGTYGHTQNGYWYKNGKPTNAQESELWAEFFASQMARDEVALANMKAHFPQAYEAMEQMAKDMLNP